MMKPGTAEQILDAGVRDAAALIVLRRDADAIRVLMGRRSERHAFHPGSVVFPGGRVSCDDRSAPSMDELDPEVAARLAVRATRHFDARTIALAAIRETFEEVGVLIGASDVKASRLLAPALWKPFLYAGIVPTLAPLRFIARAITPPGGIRRFDARFFAVFTDAVGAELPPPSDELIEPAWLTFEEAERRPLPYISRVIIAQLRDRLAVDPELEVAAPAVLHYVRDGERVQELI